MEIGLKSCYLATLPDGKFSVHVWIFCPIPQDLWLACCTAEEKKKVWTKVKSLCEHSKCLYCERALFWLHIKKNSTPCILHCNFKLQPKHTKSTEERAVHTPVASCLSYMPQMCVWSDLHWLYVTPRYTVFFFLYGIQICIYAINSDIQFKNPAKQQPDVKALVLWNQELKKWSVTWAFALLIHEQHFPDSRCNWELVEVELINRADITWSIHPFQGWGEGIYVTDLPSNEGINNKACKDPPTGNHQPCSSLLESSRSSSTAGCFLLTWYLHSTLT